MTKLSDETQIAVLTEQMKTMTSAFVKMEAKFDLLITQFVTRAEFAPIKAIVYGLVGLTLTAVIGTLLKVAVLK